MLFVLDCKADGRRTRLAAGAATLAIVATILESVAGAMKFPDAATMAVREQVIAAQSDRAAQIRELSRGEVRVADATTGRGL